MQRTHIKLRNNSFYQTKMRKRTGGNLKSKKLKGNSGIIEKQNKKRYIPKKMATYVGKKGKKEIGVGVFLEQLPYGIKFISVLNNKFML